VTLLGKALGWSMAPWEEGEELLPAEIPYLEREESALYLQQCCRTVVPLALSAKNLFVAVVPMTKENIMCQA